MKFVYEPDASRAAAHLAERLAQELQAGKKVLWLVSGGSNVALSVQILKELPAELIPQLTCLLTDERYGVPGHADSNWQQLSQAGFMASGVNFPPTLVPELTMADTCSRYADTVAAAMAEADSIIAQFGIGGDGHIAGILPRSTAVTEDTNVASYDGGVYQRITLTPPALRRIQVAYTYAYGDTKHDALQRLHDKVLPLAEQPSQILRDLPEAYIYTDQQLDTIEEEIGATS